MSRRQRSRSATSLLLLAALGTVAWVAAESAARAVPAGAATGTDEAALRRRAEPILARGPGGIPLSPLPLPQLHDEAARLGEELEAAGLDSLAGLVLVEAGWASFRLGDPVRARSELERAAALSRRAGSTRDEIAARNALASVTAATGEMERAVRLWQDLRPLQAAEGFLASTGRAWANISMAYSMMGRPPEALEAADSASSYFAVVPTPDGPSGVAIMRSQVFLSLQRPVEAEQWADSALRSARAFGVAPAIGVALGLAAAAAEAQGKTDTAIVLREEGIALQQAMGDRFMQAALRLARARLYTRGGKFDESRREIAALLPVAVAAKDPAFVHQARTLDAIDLVGLGRAEDARGILEASLAEFEAARADQQSPLSRAGLLHMGSEAYAALARIHEVAGHAEEALVAIERGRAPELAKRLGSPAATEPAFASRLRGALGEARAALIVWSETDLQPVVAVLVTGASIQAVELPPFATPASPQVALQRMAAGESDADCEAALAQVAAAALPAMLAELPAAVERLYLVPPRRLSGFPFEVLTLPGSSARTVGERFATAYLPSAASLLALVEREVGTEGMMVLADPLLPAAPDSGIVLASATYRALRAEPLPFARREMRAIGIRGATLVAGADASEARLGEALAGKPAVVHFATHALITPTRPGESAVLLAGDDGRLTAAEVERGTTPADLVTLSGCRTAGGYVIAGEGTLGLPRSFLAAGARSVVASLWDVEDRAAERFMSRFYRELRAGLPRDRALQATREAMARDGFPLRDRAAFVLVGAGHLPVAALVGEPLQSPTVPPWAWPVAATVVVSVALVVGGIVRRARGRGRPAAVGQ